MLSQIVSGNSTRMASFSACLGKQAKRSQASSTSTELHRHYFQVKRSWRRGGHLLKYFWKTSMLKASAMISGSWRRTSMARWVSIFRLHLKNWKIKTRYVRTIFSSMHTKKPFCIILLTVNCGILSSSLEDSARPDWDINTNFSVCSNRLSML